MMNICMTHSEHAGTDFVVTCDFVMDHSFPLQCQVQPQSCPYRICGAHRCTGTVFSPSILVLS